MSLLHLAELGYAASAVAGDAENREWLLEQCTGCGRCTEYCKWEVDVASNLRAERAKYFGQHDVRATASSPVGHGMPLPQLRDVDMGALLGQLRELRGVVLFCEPGRKSWWLDRFGAARSNPFGELGQVVELEFPHKHWEWGKLSDVQTTAIGRALRGCSVIWCESPELGWFLAKGVKQERKALKADVRMVWQKFFGHIAGVEFSPDVVFHESFHLTRHFPRIGYSIPMYERGLMPFHNGWNIIDCGGEGYFRYAHPYHSFEMTRRFLEDLAKDGRTVKKIVCQNLCCVEHLRPLVRGVEVTYWLDEIEGSSSARELAP